MSHLPIKAVIFDKDGTLHDTEKVFLAAWKRAAEDLDIPDIENTVRDCTGVNLPDTAVYWAKKYPDVPFEVYLARRQYHFDEIVRDGVPVKAGAMELLTYLREGGVRHWIGYLHALRHHHGASAPHRHGAVLCARRHCDGGSGEEGKAPPRVLSHRRRAAGGCACSLRRRGGFQQRDPRRLRSGDAGGDGPRPDPADGRGGGADLAGLRGIA